jgi:hypothetical protein
MIPGFYMINKIQLIIILLKSFFFFLFQAPIVLKQQYIKNDT